MLVSQLQFHFLLVSNAVDNRRNSSTARDINLTFVSIYPDGRMNQRTFVRDHLKFAGRNIGLMQFGLAKSSSGQTKTGLGIDTFGKIGVGPESLERGTLLANATPYPGILSTLKSKGIIRTQAFSLFLSSLGIAILC